VKTKYPIKTLGKLFPKGTVVKLASIEDMKKEWPGIYSNMHSGQIGVWFDGLDKPIICPKHSFEGNEVI
jgi:hypothetical protein